MRKCWEGSLSLNNKKKWTPNWNDSSALRRTAEAVWLELDLKYIQEFAHIYLSPWGAKAAKLNFNVHKNLHIFRSLSVDTNTTNKVAKNK